MLIVDLRPYDQGNWPKLFARYGADIVLGEIQNLRVNGAKAAAELPNCDMVGISDYSETRSKPGYPAVHVDCENGYRIYFNYKGIIEREQN
jgi:hypothetical protein